MAKTLLYQAMAAVVFVPTAATVVAPQTYSSEVIFQRSIIYQSQAYTPFVPTVSAAVVVPTNWNGPPPQRKRILYQSKAYAPFTPTETVTVDKWFEPWTDPTRRRRFAQYPDYTSGYLPDPSTIPEGWIPAWRDPVRLKPGLKASLQQPYTSGYLPDASVVPEGWIPALSDPVRLKPGLKTALQQPYTSGYAPDPANLPEGWIAPFSEPKRFKRAVAQQQDLAWSTFTPATEIITEDKWHQAWSEPVRVRKLATAQQKAYFAAEATIPTPPAVAAVTPEMITDAVIFQRSFIYQSVAWCPQTITTEVITEDKWHQPWSEPQRKKRSVVQQQFLAWSTFTPAPAAVTYFPMVEGDTGLLFQKTIIYQVSTEAGPTTTAETVQPPEQWTNPVRRKFNAALINVLTWSGFTPAPEVVTVDKWYQWWSEPKRFKKGLRADEQQFVAQAPVFPNLIRTIGWFDPLSEPVRQKKGLRASLQQSFTIDQNRPTQNPVFLTMSAFEINADRFFAIITTSNAAVRASVAIHEIQAIQGAAVSLEET